MAVFADANGRKWDVDIDVNQIGIVRKRCDVNIAIFTGNEFAELSRVVSDPVLLCDVLFVLCEEQAKASGVTDVQFGKAMRGDAIVHGADALYEAFANFSPSRARQPLLDLAQKGREIQNAAVVRMNEEMAKLPSAETYFRIAGGLPASSESTPAPLPTDSSP